MPTRLIATMSAYAILSISNAIVPESAFSSKACISTPQGQQCSDYVSENIRSIHVQQTGVTCWAASLVNYIRFYGADVGEGEIVAKTGAGITTANPAMMQISENNTYTDRSSG
jgi:hypothetical protein